jgi:hypothetical protein
MLTDGVDQGYLFGVQLRKQQVSIISLTVEEGSHGGKLSGIKTFRVIMGMILHVATYSILRWDVRAALPRSTVADETGRNSDKNSCNYPRKKAHRSTGATTIRELPLHMWELVNSLLK